MKKPDNADKTAAAWVAKMLRRTEPMPGTTGTGRLTRFRKPAEGPGQVPPPGPDKAVRP